jgi:hypothetical protein
LRDAEKDSPQLSLILHQDEEQAAGGGNQKLSTSAFLGGSRECVSGVAQGKERRTTGAVIFVVGT